MSGRRTFAVMRRVLSGFRRDRRTLALLFVVPLVLLALLGYLLRGSGTDVKIGVVGSGPFASGLESSSQVSATAMTASEADSKLRSGEIAGYIVAGGGLPAIYLEGSQPSLNSAVISAVVAAAGVPKPPVHYLYGGAGLDTLDYFGAGFIGLVVFFLVFVVTSVAFLRERSGGTLERLMATPLRRLEIVVGYMLAFTVVALVQSAFVLLFSLYVLRMYNAGNVGVIFLFEALLAIAAVNTGIFLSGFAKTEFQAVQFIPLVVLPQVLLSGIVFPVVTEPGALQVLSNVLPLTYDVYGLRDVMVKGLGLESGGLQVDLAVVFGFALVMLLAAAATLRRRVA